METENEEPFLVSGLWVHRPLAAAYLESFERHEPPLVPAQVSLLIPTSVIATCLERQHHRPLAPSALELDASGNQSRQQTAASATQVAGGRLLEVSFIRIYLHVGLMDLAMHDYRRNVTSGVGALLGQLQPAQPELHEAVFRLRKRRKAPQAPAAATMTNTMRFSMNLFLAT